LEQREYLRDDDRTVAIPAIDEDAGDRGQDCGGRLAEERDEPELERRVRELVGFVADGELREPRADERDALPEEEEPEVPVAQRANDAARRIAQRALRGGWIARSRIRPRALRVAAKWSASAICTGSIHVAGSSSGMSRRFAGVSTDPIG
jgi:hypothetical protein